MKSNKKTLEIKARLANIIRHILYKKRLEDFTVNQIVELFGKIFQLNHEVHWNLIERKRKRRFKKQIHEARVARGYKFKSKTSKVQYENMKINLVDSK